jgi:hypothetical protein
MKIEEDKLVALHEYLVKGGSPEQIDVAKQIGADPDDVEEVDAYVEALKARWPDIYGDSEPEPAAPAKKAAKKVAKAAPPAAAAPSAATYRLRRPDGTVAALEVIASKNGTVVLEEPRPKDLVTLIVKGDTVTVDLIELRAGSPGRVLHGTTAARLIEMAELAKA